MMATLYPYLNFMGNAEEVLHFYQSVLGGVFQAFQRFSDTAEASKLPEAERNKIMHIALKLPDGSVLMASDALESMGQKLVAGNNFYLTLNVDSKEEADRIYNNLSAEGSIELPIQTTFWGAYFGMFADKYGIQWMVNFDEKNEQ